MVDQQTDLNMIEDAFIDEFDQDNADIKYIKMFTYLLTIFTLILTIILVKR